MSQIKLRSKRSLSKDTHNTIEQKKQYSIYGQDHITLEAARMCYDALADVRKKCDRSRRYTYGDQWSDKIIDPDTGKLITEEEHILSQGKVALKNNMIRRLVKAVLGQYRSNETSPICIARDRDEQSVGQTMTIALQYNYQKNELREVDARNMEEFLIYGISCNKECYDFRDGAQDVYTDMVSYRRLFFDTSMEDIRHTDMSIIGELHDLPLEEIKRCFAKDPVDAARIIDIYGTNNIVRHSSNNRISGGRRATYDNFYAPSTVGLHRVIEVWTLESKERYKCHDYLVGEYYTIDMENIGAVTQENKNRVLMGLSQGLAEDDIPLIEYEYYVDRFWFYRFLSPSGHILAEGESPYTHKSHPYTLKLYPFINGEVHSFVEDVIDQQRYVNRLITMVDFIMGASAKGVLMIPDDGQYTDQEISAMADGWHRYNGLIIYKPSKSGALPHQVATNATNVGAYDLLRMQLQFFEDISGVHSAMQGKAAPSGTSAKLYNNQIESSSMNLIDILESFKHFREKRDMKKLKMIQQFYTDKRMIKIVGSNQKTIMYDPQMVSEVEFDLAISESNTSPSYRQIANDFLLQIFSQGQISLEQLLQTGDFPFSDQLLQSISTMKEQMANGQPTDGVPDQLVNQVKAQANPMIG